MINGLDLFSGIGGISLALSPWVRTVAYCERDEYAQAVLLSRMADAQLDPAPIWDNVCSLSGGMLPVVDIITGGFPCQDISVAGNGAGLAGGRSGLFFEIVRLARELRPRFLFLENVPAITIRGLDRVLLELTALGYDCRWTVVSAAEMGAPHLRERWFCLAHANGHALRLESEPERRGCGADQSGQNGEDRPVPDAAGFGRGQVWERPRNACGPRSSDLADAGGAGLEGWLDTETAWRALALSDSGSGSGSGWPSGVPKPSLCRGDDGLLRRVDRLRGCGNAVVPIQAREAFERLAGIK